MDDLLKRLNERIRILVESGDPSAVLEQSALESAAEVWASALSADGDPRAAPAEVITSLAYLHLARHQALPEGQDQEDLRAALGFFRLLLERAPERVPSEIEHILSSARPESDHPGRNLARRGRTALREYEQTGRLELLDIAIAALQSAVAQVSPDDIDISLYLSDLGSALTRRFQRVGNPADLDAAIDAGQRAMASTEPDRRRAGILSNLGISLKTRFDHTKDISDLDAAVDVGRQAVAAISPDHAQFAAAVSNLGDSLFARFLHAGDAADLDATIESWRQAAATTPPGHHNLPHYLGNLSVALITRFDRSNSMADVDEAVAAQETLAASVPPGEPERARYLAAIGTSLIMRYEQTRDDVDLNRGVAAFRDAVAATPSGDADSAAHLSGLAASLRKRHERTRDLADLNEAVDAAEQAVAITPHGHHGLAEYLTELGLTAIARYERGGDPADLDKVIDAAQRAIILRRPGDPAVVGSLTNLGTALTGRFEMTGDTADLDEAIDAHRRAITSAEPGRHDLAVILTNMGASLTRRFERTGSNADLDEAIEFARRAIHSAPAHHPNIVGYLSNLSQSLRERFALAGDISDLNDSIEASQRAVSTADPDQPEISKLQSNLGASLLARFGRLNALTDVNQAVTAFREAVLAAQPSHPDLANYLSNLGIALHRRYDQTADDSDLDAAIEAGQRAITATTPSHPNLSAFRTNLGNSLRTRFERSGNLADLNEALTNIRGAVAASPAGHPDLARHLLNLGNALRRRFIVAADADDLEAAVEAFQSASRAPSGQPRMRLAAARDWGSTASSMGATGRAAEGYAVAVGLLPTVAWHGLDRKTREEQLAQWAGLASDAAAHAILDARPALAVELLEQGRSVLWAQALNLRSDLTVLGEAHADLAERLQRIRKILDTQGPDSAAAISDPAGGVASAAGLTRQRQADIELRRRAAREWDQVLADVRTLDGFKHFLSATPYPELTTAAAGGPVVIVNASSYGCHALIVARDANDAHVIELPGMTNDAAIDKTNTMQRALAGTADPGRTFRDRERDRHAMLDVLEWLWDVIAEPILTALGHATPRKSNDQWPRVWWCPTGPIAMLPLHAAGHHPRHRHNNGNLDSVLDRVISSYTPTLTALTRARQTATANSVRHLGIGMPTTPGLTALPAVLGEMEVLANHFPPNEGNHQFVESQATRARVAGAMTSHSWIHMACHARQMHRDPDRSGFVLWDGTLAITDLATQPSRNRDLAFLSACQTATGSAYLLDEAVHLASAMQFLGYRHIIATMWTIADSPAPYIADGVYTRLAQGASPDASRAAEALHHTIRALRQTDPTNPMLWAPYIHLGP